MKQFFLGYLVSALLIPTLSMAQTAQLTEQLGKTVLYGDLALSPDGSHVTWVQSTAATTSKRTYIQATSGNSSAALINLEAAGERIDADPAWSPDSKTVALLSTAGEKEQRQLWLVNADGSNPRKLSQLKGYAARPRWSHDGKQVAFLFIENAGGGGPLMAASANTGVIDTAIHNQRIAVLDLPTGKLRQVSPPNLHIYDYDWSPDDKKFVATAAPGPGDNNGWIAQIYTIDIANFPNTALSKDGKIAAAARSSHEMPAEIWTGSTGEWRQLTKNNMALSPSWGKAENLEWTNEGFDIQGWLLPPARVESGKKYPMVVLIHGGPSSATTPEWPASFGMARAIIAALSSRGYYVLLPNPRGSYGQGEDFTRANVKDFGGGDLRDILAGVDAAIAKYPIDSARLGVTGWSYGGYMTMWTVTQTNRFHGAVAGAGVAYWQRYYGQKLIG